VLYGIQWKLEGFNCAHWCRAISRLCTGAAQSRDCINPVCNLEIGTQFRDSENVQRNLEIAQIPRLRGTYIQACCTPAGPALAAGCGDDMDRWQHSSHLLLHALPVASIASEWVWSPVTNTGTVSQATNTKRIDRLPCSYVITLATE